MGSSPASVVERGPTGGQSASVYARPPHRGAVVAAIASAYLLALVTAAAGVGLAVPHLGKHDAGPMAWLGLLAVVIGVTACSWSAWRLLKGLRKRWWALVMPCLAVAAYLALWTVGQGVAASFPAHPGLGSSTPADAGMSASSVVLRTADDVALAAWWVPSRNGAAVVLLHGAGSTRTAVLDHAAALVAHGYGVLLLDARGHGESDGRGMDFGWYGERDAAAALDFLAAEPDVAADRVGLVGLSMGGEVAIGTAGGDPRVRAVVAEGATNRMAADKGYLSAYGLRGEVQRSIDWATYAVAGLLTSAPRPQPLRQSVADAQSDGTPTPVLLITAGRVGTERLAAEFMQRAAPGAVEIWTVPGSGHTGGLWTDRTGWEARVTDFLDAALLG